MNQFLWVFVGGGVGSVLRHLVSLGCLQYFQSHAGLWALGFVNIIGALAAGIVVTQFHDNASMKLLLVSGVLGGFTTFSAFSLESYRYIEKGDYGISLMFLAITLLGSLLGVMLGHKMT